MRTLVTGATGYIGSRLAPRLISDGHQVRCTTRDAARLRDVDWAAATEIVEADALDADSLDRALADIETAYYLIHSIDSGPDYSETDRRAATAFARAAERAGVQRLVYLGGLGPTVGASSEHLASRREIGSILLGSAVPTAALQAAVIIGSGGASFEMLRYLTERLPIMITPRWVRTRVQPIAVADVLHYLAGCIELPPSVNRRFDIGGPDVLTYSEMMRRFAAAERLRRRLIIGVPVLSPGLSSYWVGLVTPVPAAIARPLVRSLGVEVVCSEHDIAQYVPDPPGGVLSFDDAVACALRQVRGWDVKTRWSATARTTQRDGQAAGSAASWASATQPTDPAWAGGSLFIDERSKAVRAPADSVWRVVEGIGGVNGWYSWPLAWAARGWLDVAVGGVGLRRGRRDPNHVHVGDALDFWRVEDVVPGELLRLRGEMKLPGRAWLELRVERRERTGRQRTGGEHTGGELTGSKRTGGERTDGEWGAVYRQRAVFEPRGLAGQLYWRTISPFHAIVFGRMLHNIVRQAEKDAAAAYTGPSRNRAGARAGIRS